MAEEMRRRRKKKTTRQDWKPNGVVQVLYAVWRVVFSAAKIALGAVSTVLIICAVCLFVFVGLLGDYLEDEVAPQAGIILDNMDTDLTSYLWYLDGEGDVQLLQEIHTSANRKWATYEEIPEALVHAAVAIEDKRFYEHQGVDWFTTIKAFINMFFGSDSTFGGSTITQQFVKNYTGQDDVLIQRKLLEIFQATDMEKRYDKSVVMEWYLNWIYLGQNCYGVKSAAEIYFGKELEQLTIAECASLISITNNPSIYDPYAKAFEFHFGDDEPRVMTGAERNRVRMEWTLGEMLNQGWITEDEYEEAMAQELVFKVGIDPEDKLHQCPNEECGYKGTIGTLLPDGDEYCCPECFALMKISTDASEIMYSWYTDAVLEDVAKGLAKQDGVAWNDKTQEIYMEIIRRGGYNVYTTLNMDVQNQVDKIYKNLEEIPDTRSGQQLQSAIVIIDNATGDIVAMAGGVGEKEVFDAYSCATDAPLQPGSSLKPLTIYGPAFQLGFITPATVVKDLPNYYDYDENGKITGGWPANYERNYNYKRSILTAIEQSVNASAVDTLEMIGTNYSFNFAKGQFGLSGLVSSYETADGRILTDIDKSPLALGSPTVGVSVRDMASAYAAIANDGVYREGRTFSKVYDSNGRLVLDNTQDTRVILSEKAATYLSYCLDNAVQYGTGRNMDFDKAMGIAGKTGTTSDNKDRWFCGFTPYYTAAVWCGYMQPEVIHLVGNQTNPAGRLWVKVMEPIHEGLDPMPVYDEDKLSSVTICLDSGKLATNACRNDIRGVNRTEEVKVFPEDYPTEYCDKHVNLQYCASGDGMASEYCKKFAEAGRAKLNTTALVKLTLAEVEDIRNASNFNLVSIYTRDDYVYLVDEFGVEGSWKGFDGTINNHVDAPYKLCTVHTQKAWEEYENEHVSKPTEPDSTEPETTNGFGWPWF